MRRQPRSKVSGIDRTYNFKNRSDSVTSLNVYNSLSCVKCRLYHKMAIDLVVTKSSDICHPFCMQDALIFQKSSRISSRLQRVVIRKRIEISQKVQ